MTKDDLIKHNLQKVCDYGREIQGTTIFMPTVSDGLDKNAFNEARNKVARAILFEMHWRKFKVFTEQCHDTWTKEEEDKGVELLDFLIKIWDASPETWELFWDGRQPDKPKKMPFNVPGQEQVIYINLFEVTSIMIPDMGIRS